MQKPYQQLNDTVASINILVKGLDSYIHICGEFGTTVVFIRVIYDRVKSIPWLAPLIQIWYKFGAMYGKNDNGSKM